MTKRKDPGVPAGPGVQVMRLIAIMAREPTSGPSEAREVGWSLVRLAGFAFDSGEPWAVAEDLKPGTDGLVHVVLRPFGRGVPDDQTDPLRWDTDQAVAALGDPRHQAGHLAGRRDLGWARIQEAWPPLTGAPLSAHLSEAAENLIDTLSLNKIGMVIVRHGSQEPVPFETVHGTPHFGQVEPLLVLGPHPASQ